MNSSKLSTVQRIRETLGRTTKDRRRIARLSTIGMLPFIPISLYQLGVIPHLPDLPGKLFSSDCVNSSKEAQIAGIPDGPISLLMYAFNLVLLTGAIKKKKKGNVFDYLIAGNLLGQAAGGSYYLFNMITKQKKICPYCITGALINFVSLVPLYRLFTNNRRKLSRS